MFISFLAYYCCQNETEGMRRLIIILFFPAIPILCRAQQDAGEAVLNYYRVESAEMLDAYEVERLEEYIGNPLRINVHSASRLEESGLLTHYQVVSLADYRERHGDIMSLSELSAVDGFGRDFVNRLAPFISLETYRLPSDRPSGRTVWDHELSTRAALKSGGAASYGLKYKCEIGDRFGASFAVNRPAVGRDVSPTLSGNMMWRFRKAGGYLVVGDYNARFGQGLALWNGMSMSGITAPSSLMKRPSGISASSSYSGSNTMRGAAGCISVGKMRFSSLVALPSSDKGISVLPGANASVYFRNGQISFTHYAELDLSAKQSSVADMKTSVDCSFCFKGTDLFAEAAYDWKAGVMAFLTGCVFPAGDDVKLGIAARAYPSDYSSARSAALRSLTRCSNEYSLSLASEYAAGRWIDLKRVSMPFASVRRHSGVFSLDVSCFPVPKDESDVRSLQIKARTDHTIYINSLWSMKLRLTERVRTWGKPFRTEIRSDMAYDSGTFAATFRMNVVKCVRWSVLTYGEASLKNTAGALFFRLGLFCADDWEDRIYAYERDAPGSFNVPAYYGRGVWAAMTIRWRFARWGKAYLRAAATSYALMKEEKPGRAELKLQFEFDF